MEVTSTSLLAFRGEVNHRRKEGGLRTYGHSTRAGMGRCRYEHWGQRGGRRAHQMHPTRMRMTTGVPQRMTRNAMTAIEPEAEETAMLRAGDKVGRRRAQGLFGR